MVDELCVDCGKRFPSEKILAKHWSNVHMTLEVKCPECLEVFSNRRKMWNHKKKHMDPDVKCGESFKKGFIAAHKKTHVVKEDPMADGNSYIL